MYSRSPEDIVKSHQAKNLRDISLGTSLAGLSLLAGHFLSKENLQVDMPANSLLWESKLTDNEKLLFYGRSEESENILSSRLVDRMADFFSRQSNFYRSIEDYPRSIESKEVISRHKELVRELHLLLKEYYPESDLLRSGNEAKLHTFIVNELAKQLRKRDYWLKPVYYTNIDSQDEAPLLGVSFEIIHVNHIQTTSFVWRGEPVIVREAHVENEYAVAEPMETLQTLNQIEGQSFNGGILIRGNRYGILPSDMRFKRSLLDMTRQFGGDHISYENIMSTTKFHELGHEILHRRNFESSVSFDNKVAHELFAYYISIFYSDLPSLSWHEMVSEPDKLDEVGPHRNAKLMLRNFLYEEAKLLTQSKNFDETTTVAKCFKNKELKKQLEDKVYERIVDRFPDIEKKPDINKITVFEDIGKLPIYVILFSLTAVNIVFAGRSYYNRAFSPHVSPLKKELEDAIKNIGEAEKKEQQDSSLPFMKQAIKSLNKRSLFMDKELLEIAFNLSARKNEGSNELGECLLKFAYLHDYKKLNQSVYYCLSQSLFTEFQEKLSFEDWSLLMLPLAIAETHLSKNIDDYLRDIYSLDLKARKASFDVLLNDVTSLVGKNMDPQIRQKIQQLWYQTLGIEKVI